MRYTRLVPVVAALAVAAPIPGPAPAPAADAGSPPPAYLVGFDDLPREELDDGRWANATVTDLLPALDVARLRPDDPARFREEAPTRPGVRHVERDARAVRPTFTPDDPLYEDQDAPPQINLTKAWDVTLGDDSVRVAVVDTGIQGAHEDLAGAVAAEKDFAEDDGSAQDECGHGTAVAGTLAARTTNDVGVAGAAQVSLLDAKALQPTDNGCVGSLSDVAEAIRWSADQGARVVSLSLGTSLDSSTLHEAVQYAADQGAVVVAAAGNDGPCDDCVGYPAAYDEAVAVACTTDQEAVCDFSSRGPEVEVAAPGHKVLTTQRGDDYGYWSGTSFSTPLVSAVAGLMVSAKPNITRDRVRTVLQETAQDLGPDGRDEDTGYGEVHAVEAVTTVAGIDLPPTARLATSCVSLTCTFDGSRSTDPETDSQNLSYRWTFGDGTIGYGRTIDHTYDHAGTYPIVLAVDDGNTTVHAYTNVSVRLEVQVDAHTTRPTYGPLQDPTVETRVTRLDTGAGVGGLELTARTHWDPDHAFADGPAGDLEAAVLSASPVERGLREAGLLYHRTTVSTDGDGRAAIVVPGAAGGPASAPTPGHRVVVSVTATVDQVTYQDTATYRVTALG